MLTSRVRLVAICADTESLIDEGAVRACEKWGKNHGEQIASVVVECASLAPAMAGVLIIFGCGHSNQPEKRKESRQRIGGAGKQ